MSKSIQTLKDELKEYTDQLAEVTELLKEDSSNEELKELEKDLHAAVEMASQLVQEKQPRRSRFSSPHPPSPPTPPIHGSSLNPMAKMLKPGTYCVAPFGSDKKLTQGVIHSTRQSSGICSVVFIGYGNEPVDVDFELVEAWIPFNLSSLVVGSKVQAVLPDDGMWHDAQVKHIERLSRAEDSKFTVKFDSAGEQETLVVNSYHIKPRTWQKDTEIKAPTIQPTDSESVVKRKKRLIKKLNYETKIKEQDKVRQESVNSWNKFKTKASNRRVVGSTIGKATRKESIFKTPTGSKGKVGVVGSDRPMTDYDRRGRERFDWAQHDG